MLQTATTAIPDRLIGNDCISIDLFLFISNPEVSRKKTTPGTIPGIFGQTREKSVFSGVRKANNAPLRAE